MQINHLRDVVFIDPDYQNGGSGPWTHVLIVAVEQVGGNGSAVGKPTQSVHFPANGMSRPSAHALARWWMSAAAGDRDEPVQSRRRLVKKLATVSIVDGIHGAEPIDDRRELLENIPPEFWAHGPRPGCAPTLQVLKQSFKLFARHFDHKFSGATTEDTAVVHWIGHGFSVRPPFGQGNGEYLTCSGPDEKYSEMPCVMGVDDFVNQLRVFIPAKTIYAFIDACQLELSIDDKRMSDRIRSGPPTPVEDFPMDAAQRYRERAWSIVRSSPEFGASNGISNSETFFTQALIHTFDRVQLQSTLCGSQYYDFNELMPRALSGTLARLHVSSGVSFGLVDDLVIPAFYLRNLCSAYGWGLLDALIRPSRAMVQLQSYRDTGRCAKPPNDCPSRIEIFPLLDSQIVDGYQFEVIEGNRHQLWLTEFAPRAAAKVALVWESVCGCERGRVEEIDEQYGVETRALLFEGAAAR